MIWARPITFVNATVLVGDGRIGGTLRVRGPTIASVDRPPDRGDAVIDAEGGIISVGFINAHDHLELNSFGRLKWRERYANVREWIADFQPRFGTEPALATARPQTLPDRLWAGGLKNLLSGVTTVCHHNPIHRPLKRRFPIRVVRRFGFSHSLQIDGCRVTRSYQRTPPSWPWIIHAAEGVDTEAGDEVDTLAVLRCVGHNTVLVHGVAVDEAAGQRLLAAGSSLIWCPSSNDFLFGRTAEVTGFARARRLALGTDSRLSGAGDVLDELRAARRTRQLSPEALLRTVTTGAASTLRLQGSHRLERGQLADLIVLDRLAPDPFDSIVGSTRAAVRLVMVGGAPLIGDRRMHAVFSAQRRACVDAQVDGVPRLLARWIARRAEAMRIREPGLEVSG
jgi:cytosine/adenosine deaminase-related metal-dependent hydrolase